MGYRKEVEKTTAPLKRLIFYRGDFLVTNVVIELGLTIHADGVSEGQFQQVLDQG